MNFNRVIFTVNKPPNFGWKRETHIKIRIKIPSGGSGVLMEPSFQPWWWNITYPLWRSGRTSQVEEKCASASLRSHIRPGSGSGKVAAKKKLQSLRVLIFSAFPHTDTQCTTSSTLFSFWRSVFCHNSERLQSPVPPPMTIPLWDCG